MNPESTEDVAECFPHLLPALISMSISMDKISFNGGDLLHKLNCVILGKLLRKNSDVLVYVFLLSCRIFYILCYFLFLMHEVINNINGIVIDIFIYRQTYFRLNSTLL